MKRFIIYFLIAALLGAIFQEKGGLPFGLGFFPVMALWVLFTFLRGKKVYNSGNSLSLGV